MIRLLLDRPERRAGGRVVLFQTGLAFEFIVRWWYYSHFTTAWAMTQKVHPCQVSKRADEKAKFDEPCCWNEPPSMSRGLKFSTLLMGKMGQSGICGKTEQHYYHPLNTMPVALFTHEDIVMKAMNEGHAHPVFTKDMPPYVQSEVVRPFVDHTLPWEIHWNNRESIVRQFAVLGQQQRAHHNKFPFEQTDVARMMKKRYPELPIFMVTNRTHPFSMGGQVKGSAEFAFNEYSYQLFRMFGELLPQHPEWMEMAKDENIHTVVLDTEWMDTIDVETLLSISVSRTFQMVKHYDHLKPELKERYHPFNGTEKKYYVSRKPRS